MQTVSVMSTTPGKLHNTQYKVKDLWDLVTQMGGDLPRDAKVLNVKVN